MKKAYPFINFTFLAFTTFYIGLFAWGLKDVWFNPQYLTDDALQQSYPLYKVFDKDLFKNDLITEVMEGYLAPLHYFFHYLATLFTGDPILAGHYVMLLQITLTSILFF